MFGNQLSRLPEFSNLANGNESYDSLAAKIKEMLRDPIQQKHFLPHLKNLGFKAWVYWIIHILYSSIQNQNTPEYTDKTVVELKSQIDFLKKQLEKAEDREAKANARIDTLLTLIEMKPPQSNMTTFTDQKPDPDIATYPRSELEPKDDGLTTPEQTENKRIPVPEHVEQEPEKRGFWSRFFRPYD